MPIRFTTSLAAAFFDYDLDPLDRKLAYRSWVFPITRPSGTHRKA